MGDDVLHVFVYEERSSNWACFCTAASGIEVYHPISPSFWIFFLEKELLMQYRWSHVTDSAAVCWAVCGHSSHCTGGSAAAAGQCTQVSGECCVNPGPNMGLMRGSGNAVLQGAVVTPGFRWAAEAHVGSWNIWEPALKIRPTKEGDNVLAFL